MPANWNGDLVVWAHGFRGTGLELTVDNHPLRALLIPLGFAWAASSYSRNDYDVSSGVQTTHALVKRLNGLIGNPRRVYLTGASMGGHVAAVSIEQYPNTYDAALLTCGVLGDYELFDYFLDFNVAAQQLGTGASSFPVDPVQYIGVTVPQIKANLSAVPGGWPNRPERGWPEPEEPGRAALWRRAPELRSGLVLLEHLPELRQRSRQLPVRPRNGRRHAAAGPGRRRRQQRRGIPVRH